jgi:hypothetical protein
LYVRSLCEIFLTRTDDLCESIFADRRWCTFHGRYTQRIQIHQHDQEGSMAYDVEKLLTLSQADLDALFTKSPVGEIPDGEADGTAIVAPGTKFSSTIAHFVSHFAWQGKVFDAKKGQLKNKILPFGLNAIIAKVYKGPSWLDGKECIVLDYSDTSLVAQWIRDEIRQVEPKLYLGKVYWDKTRLIDFALKF